MYIVKLSRIKKSLGIYKIMEQQYRSTTGISVGILIFILIVIMIYVIVMFELYKNQAFIFAKYTPPSPPLSANAFYPLGKVTPLTQEQIEQRNDIIRASVAV